MSALLEVRGLEKRFRVRTAAGDAELRAVDGVGFTLERGETLGLAGESGCGKSTLGRCLLRLVEPSAGRIVFDGVDITELSQRALRPLRRRMQIVFQDAVGALNPRLTVRAMLYEPM